MSANHGSDFIWATFDENVSEQTCDVYAQTTAEGFVEPPLRYRRADLPPTDAEVMNHPKVKALVEALGHYACDCGETCERLNGTCGDGARTALAELTGGKDAKAHAVQPSIFPRL